MIDYKTTSPPTGNETLLERAASANNESTISLTWLWEIIVRTRRLPDNLDAKVLFVVLRDRLRNPEREVRQNALRVLADLIPVVDQTNLDNYMEVLFQDLIVNLSYAAPAVRKGAIDVVRIHLKHTLQPNEILRKFLTAIPQDNHLVLGLILATPYLVNINGINRHMLVFVLQQLTEGMKQDLLREASLNSLVKIRKKLGKEQFNSLLTPDTIRDFEEMCKQENMVLESTPVINDNVILETEITLDTGPAITMKIHEESTKTQLNDFSDSDDDFRKHQPFVQILTDDSENEILNRSPRKVRFGGEVVKMRTPESDSNQQSSDDNDVQTAMIIDRPTSIKITLGDRVAAIKTRHKSMIPVRITTGSYPTSPRRELVTNKRLHRSAPELRKIQHSKIPLRNRQSFRQSRSDQNDKHLKLPIDRANSSTTHKEIEMLHNLTRSPVPTTEEGGDTEKQAVYNSFQICKDNVKRDDQILGHIIDNLQQKDNRTKSNNLDELVVILQENPIIVTQYNIEPLLHVLFSCESNYRLQNRVHEVLHLIITNTDPKILAKSMSHFSNNLVKFESSQTVRLSLELMEKTSPRQFFDTLTIDEPKERILQILIATSRIFPSSGIDVHNGVQLAFKSMKDPRRAVKQAALEALASLAQIAGNSKILEIVNDIAEDEEDYKNFLRIIRTRLSRRQLPMVDANGNIRYSSPKEQEELDWLCGGVISIRKTTSSNSIKLPPNNYWKHNSRHEFDVNCNSSYNLDISKLSNTEEPPNPSKERIWAIDGSHFPKLENIGPKVPLYPVYVLEENNQKFYDRRRSTSPPKNRRNETKNRRSFRHNDQFRKSFSSEQIYNNGNNRPNEPTSYSLSSRSSTTSTGSSTKSGGGVWMKTGIPIPINSNDTKLKLRYNRNHSDNNHSGPLIAQEIFNRTQLESTENSAVIHRDSPQQLPPPPRSSGSESSGYFTPPPEHHLKDQVLERYISEDTLDEINNNAESPEPDFQVIADSENENQDVAFVRQSSGSSIALSEQLDKRESSADQVDHQENLPNSPLNEFDFNENPRNFDQRSKSRSEGNINCVLPVIERKTVNSAPPLNEVINFNVVPYHYPESPPSPPPPPPLLPQRTTPVQISLPGSVSSSDQSPAKQSVDDNTPKRLNRRSIYSRGSIKRSASLKPLEIRPCSRPKEALSQALNQMNSSDWEITMQGLNAVTRLAQQHPDILEPQIHAICMALSKCIRNLRSQVARTACRAASEIFATCRKGLDMELEELAGPLLQRTADTNKFLRSDANAALDIMSLNLAISRVVAVVTNKGSTHQNCVVRAAATRLLCDIVGRIGYEKVYQLPKETREKFFIVGANSLTEGSLESRKHAKLLMSTLYKHPHFHKVLVESVPPHTIRHIAKALNSLK